ncbi:MAG: tetratricopeptide repeat protein [Elusimicrobiales bacterium]|nr:tetratricopeptide repeat protein [Elusimicrobiales bacterium]
MNTTLKYYLYGVAIACALLVTAYFALSPRPDAGQAGSTRQSGAAGAPPAAALKGPDSLDKARAMIQTGDYQGAIKVCSKFISGDGTGDQALLLQAEAYGQTGDYGKALANCHIVLKRSPKHPWALRTVAETLRRQKNYKEASEYYRKTIAADASEGKADAACAYFGLGLIAEETGDTRQARKNVEAAVKLMPENTYFSDRLAALK